MSRIAIIGSHAYIGRFVKHQMQLMAKGHEVRMPTLDSHPEWNELEIVLANRDMIEWADEVHLIWDRRSVGTVLDLGMTIMAKKVLRIIYLEPKTIENVIKLYEEKSGNGKDN
jgi:hypothetical protein